MSKNFEKERNRLLNQIKELPAPEAIEKLKSLRKDYDWAIPGYRNSLNILSDTTYQDRKHFLLELIQNADDAIYTGKNPEIKFIIEESGITLQYNEDGFSVDDIIAITDTGESTKIQGNRLSHKFIGEKGIGFKSVFALASSVEIESPPWHFILKKNECIVPYPIKNYNIKKGDGTRLKICFEEPESIELVAKELKRIIEGDMESFLFLNQLSKLTIEDKRQKSFKINSIEIKPTERNSEHLEIFSSELEETRKFYILAKDLDFPGDLVKKRWEKLNFKGKSLKRKIIVAFPDLTRKETIPVGRLYCYLPTNVSLPIPLYLQVDGVTTANREQLHDPNQNPWNQYLLSMIPGIIVEAILSLKKNPVFSNHLVDYIPWDNGDQQLKPQFEEVIELLKREKWVKTFYSGKDEWVSPEDAVIPTKFLESLILTEPTFRTRVEKYLNKKFVNPEWLKNSEWKPKLQEYGTKKIDDETFIKIIEAAPIPQQWLKKSENLVALYSKILMIPCLQNHTTYQMNKQFLEFKKSLLNSSIFPFPNRGFNSLNRLETGKKVFWISSKSSRKTGLEDSIDYTIISTEYTYQPKESGKTNPIVKNEFELKKKRNKLTCDLLDCLKIPELSDENILTELQIPYLVDNPYTNNEENIRFEVLHSIFQKYKSKHKKNRTDSEEFIGELSKLSESEFKSVSGDVKLIKDLSLPDEIKLNPEDHIFDDYFESMDFPKKFLKLEKYNTKNKRNNERLSKLKEEWHEFLILIGIRNKPKFIVKKDYYFNVNSFREKNPVIYSRWIENIGKDYTYHNSVYLHSIILDEATSKIILENSNNKYKLSNSLYTEWKKNNGLFDLSSDIYSYSKLKLKVGICYVEYIRHTQKAQKLEDNKWCGLDSSLIPLIDIKGRSIQAKECIRIKSSDVKNFQISKEYFHFVLESTRREEYRIGSFCRDYPIKYNFKRIF